MVSCSIKIDMGTKPNEIGRNTLGDAATRAARRTPNKTAFAVVETGREVTFKEFNERANRAAHAFRAAGLETGDRVGFVTGNSERMLAAEFGALKGGLVASLNNTDLDTGTVTYQLDNADVEAVVVDEQLYSKVEPYVTQANVDTVVAIEWDGTAEGEREAFESFIDGHSSTEPDVERDGSDPALILYTSGTTSRPKGVLHTHASYSYNTANVMIKHDLQSSDVVASVHPLFHIVETYLRAGVELSATNVILREFEPERFLTAIDEYDITAFYLMSSIYRRLSNETDLDSYDLSSVRHCGYGMPMEMSLRKRVIDAFDADLQLGMGQTEAGMIMFFDPKWQLKKDGNYIGRSGPYADAAIMDDDGTILQQGEVGEIVVRSPAVMDRYLNNEKKTRELWRDGWHRTGDIGKFDEDGLLLFVDRKKDMIKTGGENVSTTKVQNVVSDHPAVEEAIVVGLPHEKWTEAVTAFVILADTADATEADIRSFLRERLASFEVPKDIEFVDDLPRTATGKIRKVEIKEEYEDKYR
jgi:long-chain acyl-CoA synthetase